jgi:hypothetical protein
MGLYNAESRFRKNLWEINLKEHIYMTSYMKGQNNLHYFNKVVESNVGNNRELSCTVAEIVALFLPIMPSSILNRAVLVCFYVILYNVSGHIRYSEMKERFLASPKKDLLLSDDEEEEEEDEDDEEEEEEDDEEDDEDDESYHATDEDLDHNEDLDTDVDTDPNEDLDPDPADDSGDKKNN